MATRKSSRRYSTLKRKLEQAKEVLGKEQELQFLQHVSAANELVEHHRKEADILRSENSDLRNEVASVRSAMDQSITQSQMLTIVQQQTCEELKEENRRLKLQTIEHQQNCYELKEENERLKLQHTCNLCHISRGEKIDSDIAKPQLPALGYTEESSEGTREILGSDRYKGDSLFQTLVESILEMKLSVVSYHTNDMCISLLHPHTGYSFSLKLINMEGMDPQWVYGVSSLGSLENVALDFMKNEIVFGISMCPIFFKRISRVVNSNLA